MSKAIKQRSSKEESAYCYFKPTLTDSINILEFLLSTEEVLFADEIEILKLINIDKFSQIEVAKKMGISQPTVARILKRAYKKITQALLESKTIKIEILSK